MRLANLQALGQPEGHFDPTRANQGLPPEIDVAPRFTAKPRGNIHVGRQLMYVQSNELAKQLGKPTMVDPNLDICCESSTALINDWIGRDTDFPDPVPATIKRVALSLAVDMWKQPDATFGIAGMGETGPVRIARDLVARYDSLLIPYYDSVNGWGVG